MLMACTWIFSGIEAGSLAFHKTTIVAVSRVRAIRLLPNRDALALLKSGREVRVSRQFRARLDELCVGPRSPQPRET